MFERLQTQKNYMQIARQIRNMIREGKLNVGDRLPAERDLVQQFGASRASIREALSALEMLGRMHQIFVDKVEIAGLADLGEKLERALRRAGK